MTECPCRNPGGAAIAEAGAAGAVPFAYSVPRHKAPSGRDRYEPEGEPPSVKDPTKRKKSKTRTCVLCGGTYSVPAEIAALWRVGNGIDRALKMIKQVVDEHPHEYPMLLERLNGWVENELRLDASDRAMLDPVRVKRYDDARHAERHNSKLAHRALRKAARRKAAKS